MAKKLGTKARKFAKKNLPSVFKKRRKLKSTFKKKISKRDGWVASEDPGGNMEPLYNGRLVEDDNLQVTSLDTIFSEHDSEEIQDDSGSDGYLSEDSCCMNISYNNFNGYEDGSIVGNTLSLEIREFDLELAKKKKKLEKLKAKHPDFSQFLESYNETYRTSKNEEAPVDDLDSSWRIEDGETLCKILSFVLYEADKIFRELLGLSCSKSRKEAILELKNTSKWKSVRPLVKTYLRSTLFLVTQVTDSRILAFAISRIRASIVFFAPFPTLLRRLIKIAIHLWATGEGDLSSHSIIIVRDVASAFSSDCFDTCLIKTYKAFIAHCKFVEPSLFEHLQFLRNSFVELCYEDVHKSSTTAIASIRHLAKILQLGLQTKNKEAVKMICSCQYMNCVDLWVTFISVNVNDYDLQPLLYLMATHLAKWSYHISFPELATIMVLRLRKFDEMTDSERFRRVVKRFIDLVEQNIEYVRKKRDEVAFSPNYQQSADSFLQLEKFSGSTPFTQYYRNVMEKASSRNLGIKEKKSFLVERKSKKRRNINVDASVNIGNPASNRK
ncbi:nucleolar complex protein 2 isoform X2 [Tripterygium wilfordii]|uniref:Nucleolar complex protein 2 isoform X2 n=1 Tax=Tripterygium wilfordii TaxID=458696 RepID=A0A7J7C5Y5_TRIWF|nr:nucleolar complex protein 2 isoform X2 [Tripterygium wilfordii]